MAPSGAGVSLLRCLLVWVLAACWARADANVASPADVQCRGLSDDFSTALGSGLQDSKVTLGPGCNVLTRNFVCTPVKNPLLIVGAEGRDSIWDTEFDLYLFSVEPGIVVKLQNLVLARALVFTSVDANLQPSTSDSRTNLQLSIFHMRLGSRLMLQNVTIQTRCATLMYYWSKFPGAQKQPQPPGSTPAAPPPLSFSNTTLGAVTLQNVTMSCGSGPEPSSPVDLYVHTAPMLSAFLGASSALSISATIHLMENITLPHVSSLAAAAAAAAVGTDSSSDARNGLVEADTTITGAGSGAADGSGSSALGLTYVDANFTSAWLTVRWPARLTLQQMVLTRLAATIVAPGGSNGLLAGALPLAMVGISGSPTQPVRYFRDMVLLVPQYEVTEMTYWCVMFDVGTPELKSVADFLRPYTRLNDFDVTDASRLYLRRVRTVSSSFERVMLTSVAPPGVPFDPNVRPPDGAAAYQHVTPPLFFVGSGAEWADAVAPVLPQDTWANPPPLGGPAAADTSLQLPALLLINGTVTLTPSDVRVPGGAMRVVRRSVVVTSLRRNCSDRGVGDASPCPPAVLDMGGLINAMRLQGRNTTVVFMDITLRNVRTTLSSANMLAAATDENMVDGFFSFNRSFVHMSFESVTLELGPAMFWSLHRFISSRPRGSSAGEVGLISINDSLIQLASFQFGGTRGSYVNLTLAPGGDAVVPVYPGSAGGAGSSTGAVVPIVVGSVVGFLGFLLLIVMMGFAITVHLRRRRQQPNGEDSTEKGGSEAAGGGAKHRDSRSTSRSAGVELSSMEGSGASAAGEAFGSGVGGELPPAGDHDGKAAAVAGEESPHCTTCTISDLNSSEAAVTQLVGVTSQAMAQVPPPALQLALASASGPMARRAFSVARSVPEESVLGVDVSIDGSSSRADGISRGSAYSSSTGGGGGGAGGTRRILLDATAGGESAAAVAAAALAGGMRPSTTRLLPSLLDPPAGETGRCSGGGGLIGGGGSGVAGMLSPNSSGASARRMTRTPSGGRAHLYGVGEGGRPMGLRVRAALGRSPSRPARTSGNSNGSSNGRSASLPAPQSAMLLGSLAPAPGAAAAAGSPASCSGVRPHGGERVAYNQQQQLLRGGAQQRREASNPALVPGGEGSVGHGVASAPGPGDVIGGAQLVDTTVSTSTQLVATGGTLEPLLGGGAFDGDSSSTPSPGASTSISKVPEPASEVQRLIQELGTHGSDQLVILEPIGQGGYGTVYRGVWRNLDVAVKTILFQDRANLTPPPACCPGSNATSVVCNPPNATIQTMVIEEDDEGGEAGGGSCKSQTSSRSGSSSVIAHGPQQQQQQQQQPFAAPFHGAAAAAAAITRDSHTSGGGGGGGGTHNWALASQQAANSGSLPSVNVGAAVGGPAGGPGPGLGQLGPTGMTSQQRAVLEAAVSCSVAHPNVVATYHYDITPIPRPSGVLCSGGMLVSDIGGGGGSSYYGRGCGVVTGPGGGPAPPLAGGAAGAAVGAISDWKLYLVQEFCDAGSLANALDARAFHDPAGMPNLALTLCALADIARGMAHIHSRSIVHGDLNPTNILLRSVSGSNGGIVPMWNRVALGGGGGAGSSTGAGAPGSGSATPGSGGGGGGGGSSISAAANLRHELGVTLVAKVADFGLCGMLAPGKRHISNALRGTPFYTAPETVATGTLTKASDVFSFGVIAWEVYTGRPPFQHVPDQGFVRDESFPRLPPHVPATFANMTLACVSADPEARPTFEQILDRLMSLQSKLAVSLQQRLSRILAVGPGTFLGAASPLGPATAAATPPGAATPTAGFGGAGVGAGGLFYGSGGSQAMTMPPQTVCCAGVARGMANATALTGGVGGSPGLLAGGGSGGVGVGVGVANFPLSMPCVLPVAAGLGAAAAAPATEQWVAADAVGR